MASDIGPPDSVVPPFVISLYCPSSDPPPPPPRRLTVRLSLSVELHLAALQRHVETMHEDGML